MAVVTASAALTTPLTKPVATARRYRLGGCLVDREEATVTRDGETFALTPRTAQVLERLVAGAGDVVPRDELLDAAWQHSEVSDESLSRAVSDLRQALGDRARAPRYIVTVPRVGYRLAERPVAEDEAPPAAAILPRRRGPVAAAVVALIAATALSLLRSGAPTFEPPGFAPLTSGSALEHSPALSEDGSRIWYVAVDRYASGHVPGATIHAMNRDGSGRESILSHKGDVVTGLGVAPDGSWLAYSVDDGFHCRVLVFDRRSRSPREIDRCGRTGNVQRLAWMNRCLAYSRYESPGRQRLASWCPDGGEALDGVDAATSYAFDTPLGWHGPTGRLLLTGALGQLAWLDSRTGKLTTGEGSGPIIDATFDGNQVLALTSERGERRLAAFSMPDLTPLGSTPTVPYAHFIERAAGSDVFVLGTFGWQRRIGRIEVDGDESEQITMPERGSFHGLSVAPDGSHVVFARRGPGGWRVWSRELATGRDRPLSPGNDAAGIGLARTGSVVHVEPLSDTASRLVWTSLDGEARVRELDVPFAVASLVGGPGGTFAARCRGPAFDGICHGSERGLESWISGAASAAWDAADTTWYVATGSTVSQVTPSGLIPTYELPAAQSTGQWVVHDGRVFAYTRDAESATPQLISRSLRGAPDERAHPIDADGWNLAVSNAGHLFYTEQVYDSGSADLFLSASQD